MIRDIPRYWTGWGTGLPPQDQGAAEGRHRPAEVHRDLGVLHLTAAARGVGVGVDALGRLRAAVVHGSLDLADALDQHRHPVPAALAGGAARGVVGAPAAYLNDHAGDVLPPLSLLTETVFFQLQHGREGEGVVGAGQVRVVGPDARLAEDDVLGVVARDAGDRAVRPVEVQAGLRHAPGDAHDVDGPVAAGARALGRGHDDAGRVVGLEAAVEEVERLHDPARADDVRNRHALLEERFGILRRVLAVRDLHVRDLLRGRPVLVHVAEEGGREVLARAPHPEGHLGEVEPTDGLGRARAGAADAELAVDRQSTRL